MQANQIGLDCSDADLDILQSRLDASEPRIEAPQILKDSAFQCFGLATNL